MMKDKVQQDSSFSFEKTYEQDEDRRNLVYDN